MKLHLKKRGSNEIVNSVDVTDMNMRQIEQTIVTVMRRLDPMEYYVDDSECFPKYPTHLIEKRSKGGVIIPQGVSLN
jgi:hypothetical protein